MRDLRCESEERSGESEARALCEAFKETREWRDFMLCGRALS